MIARVTSADEEPIAVLRTFLSRTGTGKAPVEPERMILGRCRGGAVRLGTAQPGQWLVIETALSVTQACSLTAWAALSAGGIRKLLLPREATHVVICADHDTSGVGERAARDTAERFLREGRHIHIAMPPEPETDFNDILCGMVSAVTEEARRVA